MIIENLWGGGILEEGLREESFRMGCARWEGCNLIHVLVERVGCVDVGRAGCWPGFVLVGF